MPKIQVYVHEKTVMPVDQAVKRSGFVCPWTKKLFLTKASYLKHLRILRETRMHRRAKQNRLNRKLQQMWNLTSFEEIIEWVELNPEVIYDCCADSPWTYVRDRSHREKFSVQIVHLDLYYTERLSNTHSAPVGRPTNWGREPGKPTGYPGWGGRICFRVLPENCGISGSDVGRVLRMNTGTGGGGSKGIYGYDVNIFEEDFPGLGQQCLMAKLSDTKVPGFKFGVDRY